MNIQQHWRLKPQRYQLIGTKCKNCGSVHFPPAQVCSECKSIEIIAYKLPRHGKVYSFTKVHDLPSEFESQGAYFMGLIDLEDGTRIQAQITDTDFVEIGMPVEMVTRKIKDATNDQGILVYGYKFRPIIK
jgi:uncharacterized OB-fold protein